MQGINISMIRMVVWIVSGCLVAAAGVLLAPISYVDPFMGSGLLLKGFAVVIMGGMGNIQEHLSAVLYLELLIHLVKLTLELTATCLPSRS